MDEALKLNIEEEVRNIVAEQLGIDLEEVQLESQLFSDLGSDSLDLFEIAVALEEYFDVPIDAHETLRTIDMTVKMLCDLVQSKLAADGPKAA